MRDYICTEREREECASCPIECDLLRYISAHLGPYVLFLSDHIKVHISWGYGWNFGVRIFISPCKLLYSLLIRFKLCVLNYLMHLAKYSRWRRASCMNVKEFRNYTCLLCNIRGFDNITTAIIIFHCKLRPSPPAMFLRGAKLILVIYPPPPLPNDIIDQSSCLIKKKRNIIVLYFLLFSKLCCYLVFVYCSFCHGPYVTFTVTRSTTVVCMEKKSVRTETMS